MASFEFSDTTGLLDGRPIRERKIRAGGDLLNNLSLLPPREVMSFCHRIAPGRFNLRDNVLVHRDDKLKDKLAVAFKKTMCWHCQGTALGKVPSRSLQQFFYQAPGRRACPTVQRLAPQYLWTHTVR